jgi:phenylalanyl-tRNA synthetase beta chain
MTISLNWLRTFLDLPESAEEIGKLLTNCGLEVEHIEKYESIKGGLAGVVIGEVLTKEKHPDADKLSLTTVDLGDRVVPIVCGAANVAAGQKVVVATVGTTIYPASGEPLKMEKRKIRGQVSEGMICAEDELGLGTSHEGIMVLTTDLPNGTPAAEYFKLENDYIFEIGLTPNRGDAASHLGVARDLKAVLQREITLPKVDDFKIANKNLEISVEVEDAKSCPRYSGITLSGITVKESPDWLKTRLQSIGLSPINNIVDVTNFICHGLGQPLHAFDADKIEGKKITVGMGKDGDKLVTLDKQERKVNATDLVIYEGGKPGCFAGLMGGLGSSVTSETKNIFIESAYFNPANVRKSSQNQGLKTDASFRFERGIDPNNTVFALKRAALLMQELAGGEISSDIIDVYPQPIEDFQITVLYKNIDRLIGKKLEKETIHQILTDLQIHIIDETETEISVLVPPFRVDVQREADVIEEILRIYGFDNVELSAHIGATYLADFPKIDKEKVQFAISQLLAGSGFQEILTNSLTKESYTQKFSFLKTGEDVQILNKLSEDLGVMRQTMVFSGLEVLVYNINRRQKDLKIFEFGKTYSKKADAEPDASVTKKYAEKSHLTIFITGDQKQESWLEKSKSVAFHDLKSAVHKILNKLKVSKLESTDTDNQLFAYGLTYSFKNTEIVSFGMLNPSITKFADCKQPVFYADFNWDWLLKNYTTTQVYQEIPKFPEVRRDLSLVLDKQVSFKEIQALALKTEKNLLKSVNVFDVYEGENIGTDKKSYSVSFILQDETQTLTDAVIDKTMKRLMETLEKDLQAVIRK